MLVRKQQSAPDRRRPQRPRRRLNSRNGAVGIPRPPQFVSNFSATHVFRWTATTGALPGVTTDDLLNLMIVATGATTSARIIDSVRLRHIRAWAPAPAPGSAAAELAIDLAGGGTQNAFLSGRRYSDSAMGAQMAYLNIALQDGQLAGFWIQNGLTSVQIASMSLPVGTILEFTCDVKLVDTANALTGPTLVGATTGRVYGSHFNSPYVSPVGLTAL